MDLWSVEVQLLPSPQVVLDLQNSLQPLRWPLGEVVEALVVLIALHEVKPSELLSHRRTHSVLRKQAKQSNIWAHPLGVI